MIFLEITSQFIRDYFAMKRSSDLELLELLQELTEGGCERNPSVAGRVCNGFPFTLMDCDSTFERCWDEAISDDGNHYQQKESSRLLSREDYVFRRILVKPRSLSLLRFANGSFQFLTTQLALEIWQRRHIFKFYDTFNRGRLVDMTGIR